MKDLTVDFKESKNSDFLESLLDKGVVLLNFCVEWSPPCASQGLIVDQLVKRFGIKIQIKNIDMDEHHKMGTSFRITSIPTVILFKDGFEAERFVGLQNVETLSRAVENVLGVDFFAVS
ncbi:MAG: thioredoxin family protein [bacterium]